MTSIPSVEEARPARPRRRAALFLGVVMAVGLARGTYWALITDVWAPMDEAQHYGYVASLGSGDGIPVVGEGRVPPEVLALARRAPSSNFRFLPLPADPDDERWGLFAHQYEGHQPPVYYLLLTPVYLVAHPFGVLPAVYALRLASVLVSLAAVPLLWLLARELLPDRPVVAVLAPAVLVLVQGFNANLATITNDALLVPAALVPVWLAVRACRRGLTVGRAALIGAAVGLALLVKGTAATAAVLVAVVSLYAVWRQRVPLVRAVAAAAVMAGAAGAGLLPWLVWNRLAYGSVDGAAARVYELVTLPLQPPGPFSGGAVRRHLRLAASGFWEAHVVPRPDPNGYQLLWFGVLGAALVVAVVVLVVRRRSGRELAAVLFLGAAFPLAFATQLVLVFGPARGGSITLGRLLYAALPLLVLAIPAALAVWSPRALAGAVLAGVAALAGWLEVGAVDAYLAAAYLHRPAVEAPGLVPVPVGRSVEVWTGTGEVEVALPCAAEELTLIVRAADPPRSLALVGTAGGRLRLVRAEPVLGDAVGARYAVQESPGDDPLLVEVPPGLDVGTRAPADGATAEAVGTAWCPHDEVDAAEVFAHRYGVHHPVGLGLAALRAWPRSWAMALSLGVLAVLGAASLRAWRRTG